MSAIRAMVGGATTATPYDGSQAGYNAAVADLTALGGIIEIGPGNDSISLGAVPVGISIVWFRAGQVTFLGPIFQLGGGYGAAASSTFQIRSGAQSRIRLGSDSADFCQWNYNQTDTFFDWSGILNFRFGFNGPTKMQLTTSRHNLSSGVDLAFNSLPGTSGQFLVSAGAAANPAWTSVVGAGPTAAKATFYPAPLFSTNAVGTTNNGSTNQEWNGWNGFITGADRKAATQIVVPRDFNTLTNWQLYWTSSGTSALGVTFVFGHAKLTNGATANAAYTNTNNAVTPPGVADQLVVTTLTDNGVAMAPGDVLKIRIERDGTSDTNPDAMRLVGLLLNYT